MCFFGKSPALEKAHIFIYSKKECYGICALGAKPGGTRPTAISAKRNRRTGHYITCSAITRSEERRVGKECL